MSVLRELLLFFLIAEKLSNHINLAYSQKKEKARRGID
jgi:hypothetical protein